MERIAYRFSFDKDADPESVKRVLSVEDGRKLMNLRIEKLNHRKMRVYDTEEPARSVRVECERLFERDTLLSEEQDLLNQRYRHLIMEIVTLQRNKKNYIQKIEELEEGFHRLKETVSEQESIVTEVKRLLNLPEEE
jgi:uncharacterized protein (DUF1786 family)